WSSDVCSSDLLEASVHHHQRDRKHRQCNEANPEGRAFDEKRFNDGLLATAGWASAVSPGTCGAGMRLPAYHSVDSRSMACWSIISRARPPPRATQVSGSSATMTGRPVS